MSAYIIAIGGTGSKLVEAIAHMAAIGVFTKGSTSEDLNILFVDPDKGNGNLSAADKTLKIYRECSQVIGNDSKIPWMQTKIEPFQGGLWSPFNQANVRLRDTFQYDNYEDNNPVKHLFDVLYTKQERDVDLKEGFRGRPSVGSAIMTQLSQDEINQQSWETLLNQIENDFHGGKSPKVFLCGSIFGGTGASGFPTLGRLIADELGEDNRNILRQVKLGGLLMLPYFQFSAPKKSSEKQIFARSEEFFLKTEAALRYYATQDIKINPIYLLGTPNLTSVNDFSTGGGSQRNPQHYLELFGALALRDFLFTNIPTQRTVKTLSSKEAKSVSWDDIPEKKEVRTKLIRATQFAFAWLSAIIPDLDHVKETRRQRDVTWSLKFFRAIQELNDSDEQDKLNAISEWCKDYLKWVGVIHPSSSGVELLNIHAFLERNGELKLDRKEFPNLVKDGKRVAINTVLANLNSKNINPPNEGAVGLAKALYLSIEQNA